MEINIDYGADGIWIAWDEAKGVDHYPRLNVCPNPFRLKVILISQYPHAKIIMSDAAQLLCDPLMNDYIGSKLHKHDLGF